MKHFALIGYPLGHSISPLIHKELFKIKNIDADYKLLPLTKESLNSDFSSLKEFDGFNVTIPHKIEVIPHMDKLSEKAELFGAVNTVKNIDGMFEGHNTDCFGFINSARDAGIDIGGNTLILGCGGVARMFTFECLLHGGNVTVVGRNEDALKTLSYEVENKLSKKIKTTDFNNISGNFDLIINATPVGMYPNTDFSPIGEDIVINAKYAFDAIYNPIETKFLSFAKKNGLKYINGLSMLVWQAAVAEEIWLSVKFTKSEIASVTEICERKSGII